MAGADLVIVAGTRPEALKLEPLATALQRGGIATVLCVWTGQQHRPPDHSGVDWSTAGPVQHPARRRVLLSAIRQRIHVLLAGRWPTAVVVQGDTVSALAAAQAARSLGLPVIHLEAGLRSGNLRSPFPEEALRREISRLATLHLAPSALALSNLLREGFSEARIVQVGSTAVDRLTAIPRDPGPAYLDVLVDIHRHEHFSRVLARVADILTTLARQGLNIAFVDHPNPLWQRRWRDVLGARSAVEPVSPMCQLDWLARVRHTRLLISDSGGAAEEMPYLGVPLMVLRRATERPEPIQTGHAILVTPDRDQALGQIIEAALVRHWPDPWPFSEDSPYGDGSAARRAADAIAQWLAGGRQSRATASGGANG